MLDNKSTVFHRRSLPDTILTSEEAESMGATPPENELHHTSSERVLVKAKDQNLDAKKPEGNNENIFQRKYSFKDLTAEQKERG